MDSTGIVVSIGSSIVPPAGRTRPSAEYSRTCGALGSLMLTAHTSTSIPSTDSPRWDTRFRDPVTVISSPSVENTTGSPLTTSTAFPSVTVIPAPTMAMNTIATTTEAARSAARARSPLDSNLMYTRHVLALKYGPSGDLASARLPLKYQ